MPSVETRAVEPDEAGMRLDRWFLVHYPDLGFGHLQKLIRSGQVRVDGSRAKTNTRLTPGQAVRVPPLSGEGEHAEGRAAPSAVRQPTRASRDRTALDDPNPTTPDHSARGPRSAREDAVNPPPPRA